MIPTLMLGGSNVIAPASGGPGGSGTTWNPSDKTTNITLSGANLIAAANTNNFEMVRTSRANFNTSTGGKYYWEVVVDTLANTDDCFLGMKATGDTITSGTSPINNNRAIWRGSGSYFAGNGWTAGSGAASYAAGDVLMFALDIDNRKFWCGKNGTWNNSGDPAAGTNASFTTMPTATDHAALFATDNITGAVQVTLASEAGDLTYSAPSGFTAGI